MLDDVVEQLRNMILSRRLPPRARLRQEEVAARLGISRTPVREAFRVLLHEGLLIPVPGSSSVEVVELSEEDAKDLYEVRARIDGLAARLCAQRSHEIPLEELQQDLEDLRAAANPFDVERFSDAHTRFHVRLVRLSGNKRLEQTLFIVQLSTLMLYPRFAERPERMLASAKEHWAILDQIRAGNADEAERIATRHIETASDFWFGTDGSR